MIGADTGSRVGLVSLVRRGSMVVGAGDLIFGIPLAGVAIQKRINDHRAMRGLLPVFVDRDLSTAANRHTSDMANNPSIYQPPHDAHVGSDNSRSDDRIRAAAGSGGWSPEKTGEILQWGGAFLNGDAPINWWLNSPPHRAIIEDGAFIHMGFSASHNNSANEWVYAVTFARSPARGLFVKHSEKCADVAGISTASGAPIQQWDWWGGPNQKWRMEPAGDGYVRIVSQHSGKVFDIAGISTANGARLIQWDWWGGHNQQFRPEVYGFGEIRLIARHSGKVLEVADFSENNGAPIQQWDWWQGANQRWKF
jgi:hypothetical protein